MERGARFVASDGGYGFASAVLGVFRAFLCLCIPRRLIVPLCGEGVRLVSAWRCGVHSSRRGKLRLMDDGLGRGDDEGYGRGARRGSVYVILSIWRRWMICDGGVVEARYA